VIAVTTKVTTIVPQKKRLQYSIRPAVLATTIMKVADTVEKPVAMIIASRTVHLPCWYIALVTSTTTDSASLSNRKGSMAPDEHCLVLHWHTYSRERVASVASMWHPASRYRFTGSF